MKRQFALLALFTALFVAMFAFALTAAAQPWDGIDTIDAQELDQYYSQWTPQQWKKLETQLVRSLGGRVDQVDPTVIQNVIYFAAHYPDAMRLERTAGRLFRVFERHDDPQVRLLALSALHHVSEPMTMERLAEVIRYEESETIRHVGIAAVAEFNRSQDR